MAFHGKWFILIEFGGAFFALGFLAVLAFVKAQGHSLWAWYFLGIALNYLPLFLYSLLLARRGASRRGRGDFERAEAVRYTKQQFWLLVPLVVLTAAIWQEARRKPK